MASVDFLQKPFELARSSQHVIERLVEISQENARLYAPVTSAFSSFAVLYDFIVYEAGIRVAIQDFALARFELLFPAYSEIEVKTAPETEPPPSWFGAPAISLLFNISLVQTALPRPEKVSLAKEEPLFLTLQKPETPEVLQKAVQRPASEPERETLVNRVIMLQTELASELFSGLETVSSAFLEGQKQAMRIASVASESKAVLLEKTGFEDVATLRFSTPREIQEIEAMKSSKPRVAVRPAEHEVKHEIIEEQIEEPRQETLLRRVVAIQRQLMSRLAPTLEAESSALLESQKRMIPEALVSLGARTALPYESVGEKVEAPHIVVPEEKMGRVSIPKVTLEATKEEPTKSGLPLVLLSPAVGVKVAPELPELMAYVYGLPTLMLESQKPSATAFAASTMTLTSQIEPSTGTSAAPRFSPAEPAAPSIGLKKTSLPLTSWVARILLPMFESIRDLSAFPVTALTTQRLLADTLTQRIPSPETLQTSIGAETAKSRTSRGTDMKAEIFSKLQITRALATAEKMLKEKLKYEPAAFVEELQKATAMYGREMSDLAAAGPVRATMLDELAPGVLVPPMIEQYLPEESASSEVSETPAFPSQPSTSIQLTHVFPEEESINVNVFTETADEDLRELERKVGRILSEQLANSGTVGSLRTTLVGESSSGLGGLGGAGLSALDSQAIPSSLLRQVNVSEGAINLKVFTEAADEDLRDLERKIRRILSAQISRYYGSSRP